MKRVAVLAVLLVALSALAPAAATGARGLLVGLFDESETLGYPDRSFPLLKTLRVQAIRSNLYWGGPIGVATRRPAQPANPADPAYDWVPYDRMAREAAKQRIKVVFSIYRTPAWAGGGPRGNRAPRVARDLRNFAYAAAKRYSGSFVPDDSNPETQDVALPAVRHWLAWNEPNNPLFLHPQFKRVGSGKKRRWIAQSPRDYARICAAVYAGVHATLLRAEKVACGVTAPRGNNIAGRARGSIGPIAFLRGLRKAGLRRFDAYAHHPYYGKPSETPASKPKVNLGKRGRIAPPVILGNISDLVREVTRLYGRKRIWITEYGYQTRPPDRLFGVTYSKQARYLRQAYAIARRHPRIDMMLWFLLRDQRALGDWQSGLMTFRGKRKPAFGAFRLMPR
ncbi:MAG: glycosyl hydrolase [Gaiellaceae bacterium]